jgi:hypothetical protein
VVESGPIEEMLFKLTLGIETDSDVESKLIVAEGTLGDVCEREL